MFHDPGATSIIDSALFIGEREIVVKLKDIYDGIWGDKEKTEIIKERPTLTQDEINKLAEEYSKLASQNDGYTTYNTPYSISFLYRTMHLSPTTL
jgi:hypothetical protein